MKNRIRFPPYYADPALVAIDIITIHIILAIIIAVIATVIGHLLMRRHIVIVVDREQVVRTGSQYLLYLLMEMLLGDLLMFDIVAIIIVAVVIHPR